ncbi:MAG: hypothetical protein U5K37_10365 [Natrialbaceae archaeon]|nr:hypothetical protein [Natrialbaceae archaeon]
MRALLLLVLAGVTIVVVAGVGCAATVQGQPIDESSNGSITVSRTTTVTGAPVTIQVPPGREPVGWEVRSAPAGSTADIHDTAARTTSIRPDVPGSYRLGHSRSNESVVVTVENRSAIVETYAPILHFHEDGEYRPTRLEAIVENARLRTEAGIVTENMTVFDLAGRDDSHYLDLRPGTGEQPHILPIGDRDLAHYLGLAEDEPQYQTYQAAYPPTVYANVAPTTYEGEAYTAITYWYIYTWDPKTGFAKFGTHQGDVESTVVLVDSAGEPAFVAPYGHGGATMAPFETVETTATHPHLFVERGAHATYLVETARFDGDGGQVYAHWSDSDAGCGDLIAFQSLFHSERTGSADRLDPAEYDLIELTGTEVWADYEGGVTDAPGSITIPHQRAHYTDAGADLEHRGCPVHEERSGWLEITDYETTDGTVTLEVTVGNDGGKPHEFWVTVVDGEGSTLASQSVPVGTKSSRLFGDPVRTVSIEVTVDESVETVTPELWLQPPSVRSEVDYLDAAGSIQVGSDSWWFW